MQREVEWCGKTVRTRIWKSLLRGRMFAGQLKLVGDR